MIRKLLGAFCLLASVAAHGWVITNTTGKRVHIDAHYHGEIPGFSCTSDSFDLEPRQTRVVDAGICAFRGRPSAGPGALVVHKRADQYEVVAIESLFPK